METVLFFYNILIMIAFTFSCIDFSLLYYKHRDKSQLCIAVVFFLFIFDNLLLYMYEFLPGFTQGYSMHVLSYGYAANLLSFLIVLSYRLTIIALEKKTMSSREIFIWGIIFIAILAVTAISQSLTEKIVQNIVLGLPAIGVFVHALYKYRKTGGFPKRSFVPNIGSFFLWVSFFFEAFNPIEDILALSGTFLFYPNRHLSIELLSVFYSVSAIWFLLKNQISAEKHIGGAAPVDEEESKLLTKFGDAYSLTQRERDILDLLVKGYSNAEICKAACISEGTVKTHTHNIYTKLDIKNRVQLGIKIKEFQKNGMNR